MARDDIGALVALHDMLKAHPERQQTADYIEVWKRAGEAAERLRRYARGPGWTRYGNGDWVPNCCDTDDDHCASRDFSCCAPWCSHFAPDNRAPEPTHLAVDGAPRIEP